MAALLFVHTLIGCSGVLIRLALVSFHLYRSSAKVSGVSQVYLPYFCCVLGVDHDSVGNSPRTP